MHWFEREEQVAHGWRPLHCGALVHCIHIYHSVYLHIWPDHNGQGEMWVKVTLNLDAQQASSQPHTLSFFV